MSIKLAKTDRFDLGTLAVDPRLRTVSTEDNSVSLEPRVMQVLVLLSQRAGEPVDRDEMIEQCWDGLIVGDDAIQRCVGRLRRLASELGGFSIETISKVGYVLQVDGEVPSRKAPVSPARGAPDLPSLAFGPSVFRGNAGNGKDLADLLCSDVAAALSLNRELSVISPSATSDALYSARIELRHDESALRSHCSLTENATQRLVWSDVITLPDASDALQSGIPSEEAVIDIASRFSAIVAREVTQASLAQEEARAAWQAVVRANAAYQRIDLPSLAIAIREARAAVEMEPDYAAAHAALANALAAHYELGGAQNEDEAAEARQHCDLALAMAPEDASVLAWTAHSLLMITRPAEGLSLAERAVELAPWHPIANLYLARHYLHHARPAEALSALDNHARVAPLFPWKYFPIFNRGLALMMMGDVEGSYQCMKEAAALNPTYPYGWVSLMVLGALTSDTAQMQSARDRLKRIAGNDDLDLQLARIAHSYPDPAQAAMIQNAFTLAWSS